MLVGVDSVVRYLNKLTWPRAETKKKSFFLVVSGLKKSFTLDVITRG